MKIDLSDQSISAQRLADLRSELERRDQQYNELDVKFVWGLNFI